MTATRENQIRLLREEGAQAFRAGQPWQKVLQTLADKYAADKDQQQWLRGYREARYETRPDTGR